MSIAMVKVVGGLVEDAHQRCHLSQLHRQQQNYTPPQKLFSKWLHLHPSSTKFGFPFLPYMYLRIRFNSALIFDKRVHPIWYGQYRCMWSFCTTLIIPSFIRPIRNGFCGLCQGCKASHLCSVRVHDSPVSCIKLNPNENKLNPISFHWLEGMRNTFTLGYKTRTTKRRTFLTRS